ncbi:MAG: VOC family protein [Pseudomonadota bacterium]
MAIIGLGGIFFKTRDPEGLRNWYRDKLGLDFKDTLGAVLPACREGETDAYGVLGLFTEDSDYFAPSDARFMINFRVDDLAATLESLRAKDVAILGGPETHPEGLFAWIQDPEGLKIELWQPT